MFPEISNIVLSADCCQNLNLRLISQFIIESSYNPKRFSAAIIRFRKPLGTVLLFPNGKMICNGVKFREHGITSFRKVNRRLRQMGIKAKLKSVQINNVVATSTMDFEINLVNLFNEYYRPRNIGFFEPECFPNLVIPLKNMKAMIFRTGKVIFTGAKNINNILLEFDSLYPILEKYKKK